MALGSRYGEIGSGDAAGYDRFPGDIELGDLAEADPALFDDLLHDLDLPAAPASGDGDRGGSAGTSAFAS